MRCFYFHKMPDLLKHAKEHDSAVVTEGGRLVAVHGEAVRPDLCPRLSRLDWHHSSQGAALAVVRTGGQDLFWEEEIQVSFGINLISFTLSMFGEE